MKTYQLDELLGTMLRALYQRKKGRDLFDLFIASRRAKVDPPRVVECFTRYLEHDGKRVTRADCGTLVLLTAGEPREVALRVGDEELGNRLTALEMELVAAAVVRRAAVGGGLGGKGEEGEGGQHSRDNLPCVLRTVTRNAGVGSAQWADAQWCAGGSGR